jgi:hypothetical protein
MQPLTWMLCKQIFMHILDIIKASLYSVPTTPPKKARTTAAGRIGSVARHDVALEKDMPPTHSDPFATLDGCVVFNFNFFPSPGNHSI